MNIKVITKKAGLGTDVYFSLKAKAAFHLDQIKYLKELIEAWVEIGRFGLYRFDLVDAHGRFRYLSDITTDEAAMSWSVDMGAVDLKKASSDLVTLLNIFNETIPGNHPEFPQLENLEITN